MKTKSVLLLLLLLLIAANNLNAQYRAKSIICFSKHMKNMIETSHTLHYDDQGKIMSIEAKVITPKSYNMNSTEDNVEIKNIPVVYGKNVIEIPKESKYAMSFLADKLKVDNENRITSIGASLSIKYNKDGSFNEFIKDDSKYMALYNKQGQLEAVVHKSYEGMSNRIHYDKNNQIEEIALRSDYDIKAVPFWTDTRLDSVIIYKDKKIDKKIEFTYDKNNNLVDQKILMPLPKYERTVASDDSLVLFNHYVVTYEEGKGNDDDIYFKYNDWLVSILLDRRSLE